MILAWLDHQYEGDSLVGVFRSRAPAAAALEATIAKYTRKRDLPHHWAWRGDEYVLRFKVESDGDYLQVTKGHLEKVELNAPREL